VIVTAGHELRVSGSAVTLRDVPAEAMTQRLALAGIRLQDGWVAFQGQTLESVAEEFNRHNTRQLVIGDLTIRQLRIGGKFRVTDVDGFLAALRLTHGVRAVVAPLEGDGSQPQSPAIVLLGGSRAGSGRPEGPDRLPELSTRFKAQ